jgi:hypothetical protein
MTYHRNPKRWQTHDAGCLLQTVGRGQEFVSRTADYPGIIDWVGALFAKQGANRTNFGTAIRPTVTSRAWFPAPRGPDVGAILSVSYSAGQERLYYLNHPNSHPVVPISSARSDQIHRVQSLVSALKLRKLGSEPQATDQSVKLLWELCRFRAIQRSLLITGAGSSPSTSCACSSRMRRQVCYPCLRSELLR